jgi:DeoR family glycerol-3-phosphate regulon repressor
VLLAEERQNQILSLVNMHRSIAVTEIQRQLPVSRETIRRDLLLLAEQRKIRKTHGGAISLESSEPELAVRLVTNKSGKQLIGRLAAELVEDGSSVMLAAGTTVQGVSDALVGRRGLTVYSNCIATCSKLSGRNENAVHLIGGEIQPRNNACMGRDATDMLANYFADFAIIGAGAISAAGDVMDFSREEAEFNKLMMRSAKTVIVVADHQKLGRVAPVRVQSLKSATYLVTDNEPETGLSKTIAGLGAKVVWGVAGNAAKTR